MVPIQRWDSIPTYQNSRTENNSSGNGEVHFFLSRRLLKIRFPFPRNSYFISRWLRIAPLMLQVTEHFRIQLLLYAPNDWILLAHIHLDIDGNWNWNGQTSIDELWKVVENIESAASINRRTFGKNCVILFTDYDNVEMWPIEAAAMRSIGNRTNWPRIICMVMRW